MMQACFARVLQAALLSATSSQQRRFVMTPYAPRLAELRVFDRGSSVICHEHASAFYGHGVKV